MLILVLVVALLTTFSWLSIDRALEVVHARKLNIGKANVYAFAFGYSLTYFLMILLPLLMVAGYRTLQGNTLADNVAASLRMCGLEDEKLNAKMQEYNHRNSVSAFVLPMVVNFLFLLLVWGVTLFPRGFSGMLDYIEGETQNRLAIAVSLPFIASHASSIVCVFLGAYIYCLSSMTRRWVQSDLTTGVLWRLNVRFAVAFVVGLLLVNIFLHSESASVADSTYLNGFAFLVGITPDLFLRWLSNQVNRVFRLTSENIDDIFAPSQLRTKIGGMSFWQSDRLAEEGIESVEDLAMKEIPSLLLRTRFDTPLLMSWVDRALLCNQVTDALPIYRNAHILSATQLVRLARRNGGSGAEDVLEALQLARQRLMPTDQAPGSQNISTKPMRETTREELEIVVASLEMSPNLYHLNNYWKNASVPLTES